MQRKYFVCVKEVILAAAFMLCAGALAGAQTVATVYNFAGGTTSGANPWYVTLVQGTDGQLYGTTYNGGSHSKGTAFKVTTSGTFTLLHSFAGGSADGANPTGGFTLGSDGNLYGTTQMGGSGTEGVVFKMTTAGAVTVLHTFNVLTDGAFPWGPPILASDGNYYGTASGGNKNNGLVYKITSSGTFSIVLQVRSDASGLIRSLRRHRALTDSCTSRWLRVARLFAGRLCS